MVTTAFPRRPDDERATFIWSAAKAFKKAGQDVMVIAMHIPGTKTHDTWEGIEIIRPHYLPERWEVLQKEGGGLPIMWKKMPLARLALLPFILVAIATLVRLRGRYDVIHANWALAGMIAWVSQFLHRKPYVVTVHGSDIYEGGKIKLARPMIRMALNRASAVVAISQSLKNAVIEMGVKQTIHVIPEGVNTDEFYPLEAANKDYILYVGSLIQRKGVGYLLSAFPEIARAYPDLKLVIVGDGSLRHEHEAQVAASGLSERVRFLGWQEQKVVKDLMRGAKLFILPSTNEGLGVVLLEALASGTPCAGSAVDGIPDAITPDVGVLFPPGDPAALAEKVKQLLADPARYNQMRAAARRRAVEVYDWQVLAAQLNAIFKSAAARRA